MGFFFMILLLIIFVIALILGFDYLDARLKGERFAWTLPDDCFLIITTPELYSNTMCYYVKEVAKCTHKGVIFYGCLADINNPNGYKNGSFSKMALPLNWISSSKTKIVCIEHSALTKYLKQQKHNGQLT